MNTRNLLYLAAAVALTAINLVSLNGSIGSTAALFKAEAPVPGNTFSTADCFGDPDAMYVWDIDFETRIRGNGNHHDERITVTVQYDSNASCTADASDSALGGATVTVELRDGNGAVVVTETGTTAGDGTFRTGWIQSLADGTYEAWVTALSHDDHPWAPSMDVVNPGTHAIPH